MSNTTTARWYYDSDDIFKVNLFCSNCETEQIHSDAGGGMNFKTPYCPWCGAKMENSDFDD